MKKSDIDFALQKKGDNPQGQPDFGFKSVAVNKVRQLPNGLSKGSPSKLVKFLP